MSPTFRLKKLTAYPDWHKKPFLLNRAEMADPTLVFSAFFDRYDLSTIRVSLKQWVEDTLLGAAEEAATHLYTHENVARLVEAAWLVFEQTKQVPAEEGFSAAVEAGKNEEDAEEGVEERRRFVKWVPFPAALKAVPVAYMKRVFDIATLDHLCDTIQRWQKIALTAAYGRYDAAGERADLIDYCEGLLRLLEAAYVLQRHAEWDTEGRVRWELPEDLKHALLSEEQTFHLSEEETKHPQGVLEAFFDSFSPPYARRELWDMLACVVECQQADLNKLDLLFDYECLDAVLEATWLYANCIAEQRQTTPNLKTEI